jgi:hypothetical protein
MGYGRLGMKAYPPQTIAAPLTVVRRERMLPAPGEILVSAGERVEPLQVVARTQVTTGFRIVNIARQLRVHPASVPKYLKVEVGEEIQKNHVLAALRGVGARSCRSPIAGTVTGSGRGMVLIEPPPRGVELLAGMPGVVERVTEDWGVVIRNTGALIQGIWGNKKEGIGILRLLAHDRDSPIDSEDIDPSCRGMVIVGGSRLERESLEQAVELQIRGVISGSIAPDALQLANDVPFPVITTEGIGDIPMCSRIHHLLTSNEGREAVLDSHFRYKWGVVRPEIIIPLPAEPDSPPNPDTTLEIGDLVRVVRSPHQGTVGTVKELVPGVETPAGHRLPGARITPQDVEGDILVPVINLEIMR